MHLYQVLRVLIRPFWSLEVFLAFSWSMILAKTVGAGEFLRAIPRYVSSLYNVDVEVDDEKSTRNQQPFTKEMR